MAEALLLGGPCDGDKRTLPANYNYTRPIVCQGTNYIVQAGTSSPAVFLASKHVWVVLKGAPCDGQNRGLTRDKFKAGALMCSGHLYVNVLKDGQPWQTAAGAYIWQEARQLENSAAPQAAYPPHAPFVAMHRLFHTLAVFLPAQQRKQQAALRRLRRAVR